MTQRYAIRYASKDFSSQAPEDFKTNDKEYTLNTLIEKASRKVVRQTVGDYLNDYIAAFWPQTGSAMPRPFRNFVPR